MILENTGHVGYTGVVLFDLEREKLLRQFRSMVPSHWAIKADHMTINVGPATDGQAANMLGRTAELEVRRFGISDKAAAVEVSTDVPSENKLKHITIAINPDGGSSKDSNQITDWKPVPTMKLQGIIREVEQEGPPPKPKVVVPPKPPAPNDPHEFVRALAGKPAMVIMNALRGKFPHLSDVEIEQLAQK